MMPAVAPAFEICGAKISLSGVNEPCSVDIVHCVPEEIHHIGRNEGSDFVIIVGDIKLDVHKELLTLRIPFFRSLFNSSMGECSTGVINLSSQLCGFDTVIFESLVTYAYTGLLTISVENAQDLMTGAMYLQIESVIDECGRFMRRRVSIDNALPLIHFFKSISHKKENELILSFINKNFVPISQTSAFCELQVDDLAELLQRDSLYVDREEQVFDAVSRWIGSDSERVKHGATLLRSVRCTLLCKSFISEMVEKKKWVTDSPECMGLLKEAKGFLSNEIERSELNSFNPKPRVCEDAHCLLFTIGTRKGSENPLEENMEVYDPITDNWTVCTNMKRTRAGYISIFDQKIYTFGSYPGDNHPEKSEYFDTISKEWFPLSNLPKQRLYGATLSIDSRIYFIGGYDGSHVLSSVACFDPTTQEWSEKSGMTKRRLMPSSCVLDGKIYVLGGSEHYSTQSSHYLNDGECYDPETDSWSPIAPMKYRKCGIAVAAYKGHIYAAGGYVNDVLVNSMERYDPLSNTWITLNGINRGRTFAAMNVSCGRLFILGGFEQFQEYEASGAKYTNASSVEVYDIGTDSWEERAPMSKGYDLFMASFPIPAAFPSPLANLETMFHPSHSSGFRSFYLKDELLTAIAESGFINPSEVQHELIPRLVQGMSFVCQAKSGTGKTSAIVIASLQRLNPTDGHVSVLIMSPTHESVLKIKTEYERLAKYLPTVKVGVLTGDERVKKSRSVVKTNCPHIVIGTPGRILSLVQSGHLKLQTLKQFVIDECDKMTNDHVIRNDIEKVFNSAPNEKQVFITTSNLHKKYKTICEKFIEERPHIFRFHRQ